MNIKQEDIRNHIDEFDIILVGTNIYQNMGNGFPRFVRINYPYVYEKNMETKYADINKMGTILECSENNEPTFILCFVNDGKAMFRPDLKKEFVSYDSLESCLKQVSILYRGKNIASTIIGTSRFDGNGDIDKIKEIFNRHLPNITLFDYYQKSKEEELVEILKYESELKKTDLKKYYETVKVRKNEANKRKERNKRARY